MFTVVKQLKQLQAKPSKAEVMGSDPIEATYFFWAFFARAQRIIGFFYLNYPQINEVRRLCRQVNFSSQALSTKDGCDSQWSDCLQVTCPGAEKPQLLRIGSQEVNCIKVAWGKPDLRGGAKVQSYTVICDLHCCVAAVAVVVVVVVVAAVCLVLPCFLSAKDFRLVMSSIVMCHFDFNRTLMTSFDSTTRMHFAAIFVLQFHSNFVGYEEEMLLPIYWLW